MFRLPIRFVYCHVIWLKLACRLLFPPQGCLWEQGAYAQHFFVPDGPAAPDSPDCDHEAHYDHQWHREAQYHHEEHIFLRGNTVTEIFAILCPTEMNSGMME